MRDLLRYAPPRRQPRCPACGIYAPAEDWRWLAMHIVMRHSWMWIGQPTRDTDLCLCGHAFADIPALADHLSRIRDLELHFAEARLKPHE